MRSLLLLIVLASPLARGLIPPDQQAPPPATAVPIAAAAAAGDRLPARILPGAAVPGNPAALARRPAQVQPSAQPAAPAREQPQPGTGLRSSQQGQLAVSFDATAAYRPMLSVGPVLRGREIEHAARSGLPVRVRMRVELWKDRFIDQLVDSASWMTVIAFEPIGEQFFVRSLPTGGGVRRYPSFADARQVIESDYPLKLQPRSQGRYYYTATVQVERLSLSDLEELERWLQGELQPAVSGQRSLPNAIGQGAKRLMLRILDMPTRRYETRSDRFRYP
jgi:hypothetical protein